MELTMIVPGKAKAAGNVSVSEATFDQAFNPSLIHQVVTAYLAGSRAGTRGQKNRSAVSGGGKKPWRQKGTGNARAGTIRSPLWRGGGVTFAAGTQNHKQKVNKKMYRQAIRSILSELIRQQRLVVLEALNIAEPKTKLMVNLLNELQMADQTVLFVTDDLDEKVYLAARNLHKVAMIDVTEVSPVNLIRYDKVVVTKSVISALEEKLQ